MLKSIHANKTASITEFTKNPLVDSAKPRGHSNLYKIKPSSVGYRLAYLVEDKTTSLYGICVGRRDKIYKILSQRLNG